MNNLIILIISIIFLVSALLPTALGVVPSELSSVWFAVFGASWMITFLVWASNDETES